MLTEKQLLKAKEAYFAQNIRRTGIPASATSWLQEYE
jgi:hypothetical protein